MDYLKTVIPSQLISERGSNLVVINPGSANVRIGFAHQPDPFTFPHCIAHHIRNGKNEVNKGVIDQMINKQATSDQQMERENAYDIIASLLKIPYLHEEVVSSSIPRKLGRSDGYNSHQNRSETSFSWTNVREDLGSSFAAESRQNAGAKDETILGPKDVSYKFKEFICGEDALKISPADPYLLCCPIRRGHFNISLRYSPQQVYEDLCSIWDWILIEKLHILPTDRNLYSCVLVVPETFDNREMKEMLTIVLKDLKFGSAVLHQEGLAAAFGNGLSTACAVNIGAHTTSIICVEDGAVLPYTNITLPYGGDDISRCMLWVQQRHQTWPVVSTDPLANPIDMLMLNKLKETFCQIREGEFDAVAIVHSFQEGKPAGSHKTRLSSLNVPPMGLFFPRLLVHEEFPSAPRTGFNDYDDMLEDSVLENLYIGGNGGQYPWDNYPAFQERLRRDDNLGLAEAIASSILATGRIELERKLFCSIQLLGGAALTSGLVAALEERVLQAIPSNEAIDTVEVLLSRNDPSLVPWRGGALLSILDFGRDSWIKRDDWLENGVIVKSCKKYRDGSYIQAQAMCYMNK